MSKIEDVDSKIVGPGIGLETLGRRPTDRGDPPGNTSLVGEDGDVDEGELGAEEAGGRVGDDEIPDGGYGWVIVCCMIAMNASTWGEFFARASMSSGGMAEDGGICIPCSP